VELVITHLFGEWLVKNRDYADMDAVKIEDLK
jgi:hypothetical protein